MMILKNEIDFDQFSRNLKESINNNRIAGNNNIVS